MGGVHNFVEFPVMQDSATCFANAVLPLEGSYHQEGSYDAVNAVLPPEGSYNAASSGGVKRCCQCCFTTRGVIQCCATTRGSTC